jgi:hypothetical protein
MDVLRALRDGALCVRDRFDGSARGGSGMRPAVRSTRLRWQGRRPRCTASRAKAALRLIVVRPPG